jgi:hypothetical protein
MLLWLAVIACESTSVFTGGHTVVWARRLLALFSDHVTWAQAAFANNVLRKTGHFVGYATLSWFAFRGWTETFAYRRERFLLRAGRPITHERRWHLRAAAFAILCTIVVAGLDEFHQTFIPGRTGVFHDVILDSMGGIFAQILLLWWWTQRPQKKEATGSRTKFTAVDAVTD